MKTEDLPVYRLAHELIIHTVSYTKNFPKDYKFSLGERMKEELFESALEIFRANSTYNNQNRKQHITNSLEKIKVMEMLLRLCKDIQILSVKQYSSLVDLTDQIGKQLTGWRRSTS